MKDTGFIAGLDTGNHQLSLLNLTDGRLDDYILRGQYDLATSSGETPPKVDEPPVALQVSTDFQIEEVHAVTGASATNWGTDFYVDTNFFEPQKPTDFVIASGIY